MVLFLLSGGLVYYYAWESKETSNLAIPTSDYYFGQDMDQRICAEWANQGECRLNRIEMLSKCPDSCHRIAGVNLERLSEHEIMEDAILGFAHFLHEGDHHVHASDSSDTTSSDIEDYHEEDCMDHKEECENWALEGHCMEQSDTMLKVCPKSCFACFGHERNTVTIDFGVAQEVSHSDPDIQDKIRNIIQSTRYYMIQEVFASEEHKDVRRDCHNLDPYCSLYAAMGECHGENEALAMFLNCAPSCHACHGLEHSRRCMRRPEDVNIFRPGQMNANFERIMRDYHSQYTPTILMRPDFHHHSSSSADVKKDASLGIISSSDDDLDDAYPWIITLENLLTDEECDWFISKGHEIGFQDATEITDEIAEDGMYGDHMGGGRVSVDAWCFEDCEADPIAKRVQDRIMELTMIPINHTEYMEIVKYDVGGHFEEHHDVIATQGHQRCGHRIMTVYIFLNTVQEGGELVFNELEITVTPKKGTAVIYQNVLDDDNFDKIQDLTFHEFMPVTKGIGYSSHWWLHPREVRKALENDCCL